MVKQRTKSDCVVTAIANALGIPYSVVKKKCGPIRVGLEPHEVDWLVGEFAEYRKVRFRKRRTTSEVIKKYAFGEFLLTLASDPFRDQSHMVALVDGKVIGDYSEEWAVLEIYILHEPYT